MTKEIKVNDLVFKKQPISTSTISNIFGQNNDGKWISVRENNKLVYYYGTSDMVSITSDYSVAGSKAANNSSFFFRVNLWKRLITVGDNLYLTAYRFIPRFIDANPVTTTKAPANTSMFSKSEEWKHGDKFRREYVMIRFDGGVNVIDTTITLKKGGKSVSPNPTPSVLKTVYSYTNIQNIPNEKTQNWLTGGTYLQDYTNQLNFIDQAVAEEAGRTGGRSSAPGRPGGPRKKAPSQPRAPRRAAPPAPVRVEFGPSLEFGPSMASMEGKPYILQRYIIEVNDLPQQITRRFWVKLVPNSFQYSDLSSQWNEIERPGNYAITDWSKYKPLKVSFRFLIAGEFDSSRLIQSPSEIPLDGMQSSIEKELRDLRAIATAPHPISLVNFQPYLTDTMRYPFLQDKTGAKFIISDLSVTASRFSDAGITTTSAAEISISLTEYIESSVQLAVLPPIKAQGEIPTKQEETPIDVSKNKVTHTFTIPR
jgi:hypothetical protein